MAKFFALGPLVLVLCLVLCDNADPSINLTQSTAPTTASPTTKGDSADQSNNPTQSTAPTTASPTTKDTGKGDKVTQTNLPTPTTLSNTPADSTKDAGKSGAVTQTYLPTPTTSPNTPTDSTKGTTGSPCQYSVLESVNKTGAHVVNIKGPEDQNYTISIKDKHNEIRAEQISNQTAFKIPFEWLKPCTVYTVSVDDCELKGNNTFTSSKNGETVPKTAVKNMTDNKVCLKGVFNGIQWDLTECVKITEQNSCVSSTHTVVLDTCNYKMNVALPPVKPHINFSETIPSQFEWINKPAQCNAALLIINCINNENKNSIIYGLNTPVSLLPDTEYTCTGEYPYEKQHIKSNELSFQIKCDWQKNGRFQPLSSTSLEISWNSLEGDKCSGIEWDSYSVSCSDGSSHRGSCSQDSGTSTVCNITGLLPYKKYDCNIIGTVNQKDYVIYTGNSVTLSDKPIFRPNIKVHNPTHNSFEINCEKMETDIVWNGGKGTFRAEITYNGETITAGPQNKCLFTFSDLYYLATYDVKITVENKEGLSAFITSEATTKCKNNLFSFQHNKRRCVIFQLSSIIFICSIYHLSQSALKLHFVLVFKLAYIYVCVCVCVCVCILQAKVFKNMGGATIKINSVFGWSWDLSMISTILTTIRLSLDSGIS